MYQYLQNSLSKRVLFALIFVGLCISVNDSKAQNQTPSQLDSVISNLQSLIEVTGPQVQLSENPQNLKEVYDLFRNELQEGLNDIPESKILEAENYQLHQNKDSSLESGYRRQIRDFHIIVDLIINRQQLAHLHNYMAVLSVQQNQLLMLYDMGYMPWQEVRDVMGKQAELEMKLRTISRQQQLIQVGRDLSQLTDDLPVLTVSVDLIEEGSIDMLKKLYPEYQALLDEYNRSYHQHYLQADQIHMANLEDPASELIGLLNQFQTKEKIIETKRYLYHKLIQISSLVPELPIANYTELYDPEKFISSASD